MLRANYTLECVRVDHDDDLALIVELKPDYYHRPRFDGSSIDKRQNSARLQIGFREFAMMAAELESDLRDCYRILLQHGLLEKLMPAKSARKRPPSRRVASSSPYRRALTRGRQTSRPSWRSYRRPALAACGPSQPG
jgi:hypothetical protein